MSLATDRAAIATLLSAVDDVNGFPYRTRSMNPGDAWPLIEDMERGPANDFDVTWRVIVVLPTGEVAAMDWFEAHYEPIVEALEDFGYVERIEPGFLAVEVGTRDCMILTLRKEA